MRPALFIFKPFRCGYSLLKCLNIHHYQVHHRIFLGFTSYLNVDRGRR
nr:MAG TPA: hypothetical protein [Caudoviricetes sp.]